MALAACTLCGIPQENRFVTLLTDGDDDVMASICMSCQGRPVAELLAALRHAQPEHGVRWVLPASDWYARWLTPVPGRS